MAKTWRRLPAKTRLRRVDEQANSIDSPIIKNMIFLKMHNGSTILPVVRPKSSSTSNSLGGKTVLF
jgi:hypothetical protein